MTHASVSYLPGRHGTRPALASPASPPVHDVTAIAVQLADAWRLWNCTSQPAALRDVQRHLADIILAACTAAYLIDPEGMTGEPDPAA